MAGRRVGGRADEVVAGGVVGVPLDGDPRLQPDGLDRYRGAATG
ncbi:MAG TPA: hypothetical protein VHF27_02545 [Acidimicrobiales bacterium]|nr:hypothetical protein [Acidimicrobiales bacterium]